MEMHPSRCKVLNIAFRQSFRWKTAATYRLWIFEWACRLVTATSHQSRVEPTKSTRVPVLRKTNPTATTHVQNTKHPPVTMHSTSIQNHLSLRLHLFSSFSHVRGTQWTVLRSARLAMFRGAGTKTVNKTDYCQVRVWIGNQLWLRCSLCLRVKAVEAVAATGVIRKQGQFTYGRGDEGKSKESS